MGPIAYFAWFKENWARTGAIVGLFIAAYSAVLVLPKILLSFAFLMYTPLYMLHEFDEYVFPGGFAGFMNANIYKADPEDGPVDSNAFLGINMFTWAAL
jgi:hypothetical protein